MVFTMANPNPAHPVRIASFRLGSYPGGDIIAAVSSNGSYLGDVYISTSPRGLTLIGTIEVPVEFRRLGVASALLREVERVAGGAGNVRAHGPHSEAGEQLLRACGYRPTSAGWRHR